METDATAEEDDTPTAGAGPGAPKKSKPKKSTTVVVAQRVEDVLRLRIDGATFSDLRDYAGQNGWGVSDSMLKKYVEKSDELLKERTEKHRGKTTRLHLARREGLFARAVAAGDLRTALATLDSSAKLQGLWIDDRRFREQQREQKALAGEFVALREALQKADIWGDDEAVKLLNGMTIEQRIDLAAVLKRYGVDPGHPYPDRVDAEIAKMRRLIGLPPEPTAAPADSGP